MTKAATSTNRGGFLTKFVVKERQMAKVDFINAERLREIVDYNPETGEFTWKFCHRRRKNKDGKVGHLSEAGYIQMYVDGVNTRAHRLAWLHFHGCHPSGYIDHINGDKADNRIANLRDVAPAVNSQNRTDNPLRNKNGEVGLTAYQGGYRVHIDAHSKRHYLGAYETRAEAKAAYNAGRLILHRDGLAR
jgi:hypothetical protein